MKHDNDIQTLIVPMYGSSVEGGGMPLELDQEDRTLRYRDAPRVPRDTEPCRMWIFVGLVTFLGLCIAALGAGAIYAAQAGVEAAMAYADAFLPAMIQWMVEVLK